MLYRILQDHAFPNSSISSEPLSMSPYQDIVEKAPINQTSSREETPQDEVRYQDTTTVPPSSFETTLLVLDILFGLVSR